jgi:hypothetical protein
LFSDKQNSFTEIDRKERIYMKNQVG